MILDSQNQFRKDFIESLPHARSAAELIQAVDASQMPAAYKTRFNTWVGTLGNTVIRLSAEEKAKAFVDYLDQDIRRELNELIQGEDEAARELRQRAGRGQVLLASRDGGKTFTELLTPEEATKVDPLQIELLTPTLRSTTTQIPEVLDEQSLLQVQKHLVDQHFLVQSASIENRIAHMDVVSPKGAPYTVTVNTAQVLWKPLEFTFVNAQGISKTVLETQLPESYGEVVSEETRIRNLDEFILSKEGERPLPPEEGAGISPLQIPPPLPPLPPRAPEMQGLLAQETHLTTLVDVMASKARLARQQAELAKAQKREQERYEKTQKEAEMRRVQKEQALQTQTKVGGTSNLVKSLIGGGAVASITGASVGVPVWLTLITGLTT